MEKRLITFAGLRKSCEYREGVRCSYAIRRPFEMERCKQELCPRWQRLQRASAHALDTTAKMMKEAIRKVYEERFGVTAVDYKGSISRRKNTVAVEICENGMVVEHGKGGTTYVMVELSDIAKLGK